MDKKNVVPHVVLVLSKKVVLFGSQFLICPDGVVSDTKTTDAKSAGIRFILLR